MTLPLIPGYAKVSSVRRGPRVEVLRATRRADGLPVFIKTTVADPPGQRDVAALEREFALGQRIDHDHVIAYHAMVRHARGVAVVTEDFGGEPLDARVFDPQPLTEVCSIACGIARGLRAIHAGGLIHHDLCPSHVLVHPEDGTVKVMSLGHASELVSASHHLLQPPVHAGSLRHMAPERTGRMNRAVDLRCDLYSLGVILYELLCGRPLFEGDDPLDLVYAHIAKAPVPPLRIRPEIPRPLNDIVLKLLAKDPGERYQNGTELLWALDAVGLGDGADSRRTPAVLFEAPFRIPEHLYGRTREVAQIQRSFSRLGQTPEAKGLVLVSGGSGVGKSSLVRELYEPLVRERGQFISGKFDQLCRDLPYAGIIEAFAGLIRQLLSGTEASLRTWRERLLGALGDDAQVIIEVIPDLAAITGPCPATCDMRATESGNRFRRLFAAFVGVFASAEYPLAIFLDDLQWADASSLSLLGYIAAAPECRYLLLIGGYRDNEVSADHPLFDAVREAERHIRVERIVLGPLNFESTHRLISDTLHLDDERSMELANIVFARTRGNPFFLKAFLKMLHAERLLRFSWARQEWHWDAQAVAALDYTDNVVDLMVHRLRALPKGTQRALALGACLGVRFRLSDLAALVGAPAVEVHRLLSPALETGMIRPLGEDHRWVQYLGDAEQHASFGFGHDRVQQAAQVLIAGSERKAVHLRIGRLLLERLSESELDERLFETMSQCNAAPRLVVDPVERRRFAELNLRAARKAKRASAYAVALEVARAGAAFLPADPWEAGGHQLALDYQVELGELQYLNALWDESIASFDIALSRARGVQERCRVNEYRVTLYRTKHDIRRGLEVALGALRELGIELDPFPDDASVASEMERVAPLLSRLDLDTIQDSPELADPLLRHAMVLLRESFSHAYFLGSRLTALIGLRMTEITAEHGVSPYSSEGLMMLSSVTLTAVLRDYDAACCVGRSALRLSEQRYPGAPVHEALLRGIWGTFVCHYHEPTSGVRREVERGFESGVKTGSYQWAALGAHTLVFASMWGDVSIPRVEATLERVTPRWAMIDPGTVNHAHAIAATLDSLRVSRANPSDLSESWPEQEVAFAAAVERDDILSPFVTLLCRLALANWFGDEPLALMLAEQGAEAAGRLSCWFGAPVFLFNQALAYAGAMGAASEEDGARYRETIASSLRDFERWSKHCPSTYAHQAHLLRAELARLDGDLRAAMDAYDSAIDSARAHGFAQNEGLACDRAAAFYRSLDKPRLASPYERAANDAYERWGAFALLKRRAQGRESAPAPSSLGDTLDLASMLEISKTISEETRVEALLSRALRVIAEAAGAQRGALVTREEDGELLVRVRVEEERDIDPRIVPLTECDAVSVGAVRYVLRTGHTVQLADATQRPGPFPTDMHLASGRVKSVLCIPLSSKSRTLGVLYLEHRLTSEAFSRDRLPLVSALCSTAASALENALLYADLRREVSERERAEEALRVDRARFAGLLDLAGEGIVSVDADQRVILFNKRAEAIFGYSAQEMIGQPFGRLLPEAFRTRHEAIVRAYTGRQGVSNPAPPVQGRGQRKGGETFPASVAISRLELAGRRIVTAVIRDISDTAAMEAHRELLMRELDHRVKNNLAAIDAMLRLSASRATDVGELVETFGARLGAMGNLHEMLARHSWEAVGIRQIIAMTLEPFTVGEQLRIEGPRVALPSRVARPLGMALHELGVNAAKYGALSAAEGTVSIRWTGAIDGKVTIDWAEKGGPEVAAITPGIGLRVVQSLVEYEIGGSAKCSAPPSGVRWLLEICVR